MVCDCHFGDIGPDGDFPDLLIFCHIGGAGMTQLFRLIACLALALTVAACTPAARAPDASQAQLDAVAYRAAGPSTLTLITVINNSTGAGGHTALMINGSQRVIFDPAGSFFHETIPQRGDTIFGVTPQVLQAYKGAHSRAAYHVVTQEVQVAPEVATQAIRLALAQGRVSSAQCSTTTSSILRQLPGFQSVKSTWYPAKLMESFAGLPGVVTDKYYENDAGDVLDGVTGL